MSVREGDVMIQAEVGGIALGGVCGLGFFLRASGTALSTL